MSVSSTLSGRRRLDKINLMNFKRSSDAPEKIMFQHTILDAANSYLTFGLVDQNGTKPSEFWFSYEYFYRVRSYEPDTWKSCRTEDISDGQIKAMCFDNHFNISNIRLSMDTFLRWLKRERTSIVDQNFQQIKTYLTQLQPPNHDTINLIDDSTLRQILISPESPEQVSRITSYRAADKNRIGVHGDSKDVSVIVGNNSD